MSIIDTYPYLWSHDICKTHRWSFKITLELLNPALNKNYINIYSCNFLKMDGLPREDMSRTDTSPYLWSHYICKTLIWSFKITLELLNPALDRYYINFYWCNFLKMDVSPREDLSRTDTSPYLWSHYICKTLILSFKIKLELLNPALDRYDINIYSSKYLSPVPPSTRPAPLHTSPMPPSVSWTFV